MRRGRSSNRRLDFWVGIPLLHVLALLHRRRKVPVEIQKIGVLSSAALGDTLLFSGALQDVRAAYPAAEIVHLCTAQNVAAAEMIPGASRRVLISLTKPWPSVKAMRAEKFDVLLDFTSWPRLTAVYTLLAGAKYTVGFRTAGQHRSVGYDKTVEHRADCHEVVNLRRLAAVLGEEELGTRFEDRGHAPAVVVRETAEVPFAEEPDVVALHLWASGQRSWLREWPEERWVALAQRLAGPETLFVVTGAPSDAERSAPFVEKLRAAGLRAEAFVSPDGFTTLVHVLRRSRLVVSVNTGVMHLAAIAGARLVAINGPNSNRRWGPVGPRAVGVEAPGEGCGYLHLGFNFDGQATDCMKRTSVEMVYDAAQKLLAEER